MSGANLTKDPMDLGRVAMPLVRLMKNGRLSWAQKQEIADLIFDLCRERGEWEKEAQHISMSEAVAGLARDISGMGGKVAL